MRNVLPALSAARSPRGLVKANGQAISGWIGFEVDSNNFYSADTFRARFAVSKLPASNDIAWWLAQGQIDIELLVGFPPEPSAYSPSDLESIFVGRVDDQSVSWDGRTMEISGRDLTSVLIDAKTSEKFVNLTASEIATKLAKAHGLTPVVTATKTKAGTFYQIDKVRLQSDASEWDLLTWLAREEQFAVFVRGSELHFQPKPAESQDPYILRWTPGEDGGPPTVNGSRVTTSRNLSLAKDIKVTVRSWNAKNKKAFSKTAQVTRTRNAVTRSAGRPVTPVQEFSYTIPGLTPEQALQRAQQLLAEQSRQEMKLSIDGPADNILQITDVLKFEGTGTNADQVYFPDSIVRTMSLQDGYTWHVEAKNHSPETEVTL